MATRSRPPQGRLEIIRHPPSAAGVRQQLTRLGFGFDRAAAQKDAIEDWP
jgi:hypothetical protein